MGRRADSRSDIAVPVTRRVCSSSRCRQCVVTTSTTRIARIQSPTALSAQDGEWALSALLGRQLRTRVCDRTSRSVLHCACWLLDAASLPLPHHPATAAPLARRSLQGRSHTSGRSRVSFSVPITDRLPSPEAADSLAGGGDASQADQLTNNHLLVQRAMMAIRGAPLSYQRNGWVRARSSNSPWRGAAEWWIDGSAAWHQHAGYSLPDCDEQG